MSEPVLASGQPAPGPGNLARRLWPLLVVCGSAWAVAEGGDAEPAAGGGWTLIGRQGLVRHVVVPADELRDRAAYQRQIERLCRDPNQACFVNFYANPSGAALALPLPEAIEQEATLVFRRSPKRGSENWQWRCSLDMGPGPCF